MVSAPMSLGHQHHHGHLPMEHLQAAGVFCSHEQSHQFKPSLSSSGVGVLPLSKLGSMALDTLKKQVTVSHAQGNSILPFTPEVLKSVLSC